MGEDYLQVRGDGMFSEFYGVQGTKKFSSDSPGLLDFVVGLVEFILHLPDGQIKVFGNVF